MLAYLHLYMPDISVAFVLKNGRMALQISCNIHLLYNNSSKPLLTLLLAASALTLFNYKNEPVDICFL